MLGWRMRLHLRGQEEEVGDRGGIRRVKGGGEEIEEGERKEDRGGGEREGGSN